MRKETVNAKAVSYTHLDVYKRQTVHYAANMNEQHYPFDEKELERAGIRLHHIDIARSPYMPVSYTHLFPAPLRPSSP